MGTPLELECGFQCTTSRNPIILPPKMTGSM
jgi:hypothetical protein